MLGGTHIFSNQGSYNSDQPTGAFGELGRNLSAQAGIDPHSLAMALRQFQMMPQDAQQFAAQDVAPMLPNGQLPQFLQNPF